jgi:hypothetical protein
MIRRKLVALGLALTGLAALPAGASAGEEILGKANYADATTYSCRTEAIPINPGQNLNLFGGTTTCPNPVKVSGDGPEAPSGAGYVTRFKPSMVEVDDEGAVIGTPSVYDLHLHHVVWLNGNIRFASGEEKTEVKLPQGYGFETTAAAGWSLNYMIHSLNASGGRQVYITWEIDWVPVESTSGASIEPATTQWLDVAGAPQIYPVFDAERGFDGDGDGDFVFPDDVESADPGDPSLEEEGKISDSKQWVVPSGGRTLVFGAGHLHPGGKSVDLQIARDGDDAGSTDGDDPSEVKKLFHSDAKYYDPAGAVSWDVGMKATRPEWRVSVKEGDTLSIDATYDVEKASWYESMGILPLAITTAADPLAKDPFDDAAAVQAMYDAGGILTHGRLEENIDAKAGDDLGLPDPRKLESKGKVKKNEAIEIDGFRYQTGGYSAFRNMPQSFLRPPLVRPGFGVNFTNTEAFAGQPDDQQVWHSITSCRAPCNRGSGIGYPLANGPIKFDSGQLGFGTNGSAGGGIFNFNAGVTTGTSEYTTPPLTKAGKTYTYFCRIHPFMRGSVRVKKPNEN